VLIRRATPDDAEAVLNCLHAAFEPYRERYTPEGYRDTTLTPETVRKRMASMAIFVAVAPDGEVVGTIAAAIADAGVGHLRGMAVLPAWQGAGVAALLLDAAERELRDRRCSLVTLDTTEPLRRATRFYEKHGYRASGRVSDFFGMPVYEYVKGL
jgi:GNAT superfamily N-acetyltransferase